MNAVLAVLILWAGPQPGLSQRQAGNASVSPETAALLARKRELFERNLGRVGTSVVLGVYSYTAPYPGWYEYSYINDDGRVASGHNSPDWSCMACWTAQVSQEQVVSFENQLGELQIIDQAERPIEVPGKTYTVILARRNGTLVRHDYVGDLSPELARFVDEARSQVKAAILKRLREESRPPKAKHNNSMHRSARRGSSCVIKVDRRLRAR